MGLLDDLLGGKKENEENIGNVPFKVWLSFSPVRLAAMKDNKVNMIVKITNTSGENQLVSIDIILPKKDLIGFEPTCMKKHEEKKIGELKADETKEVVVQIHGTNQTKEGNYQINIAVYSHYMDYSKVLKSIKKSATIRVV